MVGTNTQSPNSPVGKSHRTRCDADGVCNIISSVERVEKPVANSTTATPTATMRAMKTHTNRTFGRVAIVDRTKCICILHEMLAGCKWRDVINVGNGKTQMHRRNSFKLFESNP